MYTILGVVAAGAIFGATRYFAKGTPRTMNKEWQEATNEYLKVSSELWSLVLPSWAWGTAKPAGHLDHRLQGCRIITVMLTMLRHLGEQDRAYHLGRQPRLQGPRCRPKSSSTKGVIYITLIETNIDGGPVKLNFLALTVERGAYGRERTCILQLSSCSICHCIKGAIQAERNHFNSGLFPRFRCP
jgi:hypothetical protein